MFNMLNGALLSRAVIWVTLSIRDLEDRIETIEIARNLEYERREKD